MTARCPAGLGRSTVTLTLASTSPRPINRKAAAAALPSGKESRLSKIKNSIAGALREGVTFEDTSDSGSRTRLEAVGPAMVALERLHGFFSSSIVGAS